MSRGAWFREWFGSDYLALYAHRDRPEARRAVALLREAAGIGPGDRILDLGCGPGRHLRELGRIGCRITGLDLSLRMLEEARNAVPAARLVRADMRSLPFRGDGFDAVTSYFTSFGYFEDADDDLKVLWEVRRVLKTGGWYLLDFLNAEEVSANLRIEDRRTVSGLDVVQGRRIVEGGRIVEKRIRIASGGGTPAREFLERVRLYRPGDLDSMLLRTGLRPGPVFGGYDGSPHGPASPRYIVLARACR